MSSPQSGTPEKSADEHLYDNHSPSYEAVDTGAEATPTSPTDETPEERAARLQLLQEELIKVEEEIITLRQVLGAKVRRAAEIKRQMGITPFQEFKQDLQSGLKSIQDSDAMQKTNEKISHMKEKITSSSAYQKTNEKIHDINDKITHSTAYQKTSSVVKTASEKTTAAFSTVSKKLSDVRHSSTFKSMEEKVGEAVANVKAKVSGSKSENNVDALHEETKETKSESGDSKTEEKEIPL